MHLKQKVKLAVGEALLARSDVYEGTANKADPTAVTTYTFTVGKVDGYQGERPYLEATVTQFWGPTLKVKLWTGREWRDVLFVSDVVNKRLYPLVKLASDCLFDALNRDLIEMYAASDMDAALYDAHPDDFEYRG